MLNAPARTAAATPVYQQPDPATLHVVMDETRKVSDNSGSPGEAGTETGTAF